VRSRTLRPFQSAIEQLSAELAPASTLARVQAVWERAAGPAILTAARPTAEHDGVLTLTCTAAVWAQELDLMSFELIERLNAELGSPAIRELRCRTA
jgi:predicted nucleic acid-binding Zn ribbon protein